jgi:hypothetical protein
MSGSNYNYFDPQNSEEIINSLAIKRLRQPTTGGTLSTHYGNDYEQHIRESDISLNGGRLWDSPFARQRQEDEAEEQLRSTVSEHSVNVKRINDSSAEEEEMKQDMIKTAAAVEQARTIRRRGTAHPLIMIHVQVPEQLKTAAGIEKIIINKRDSSLWIKSAAAGKSIYLKLQTPNAIENTNRFVTKALSKKAFPEHVTAALAEHLQHGPFADIERLYHDTTTGSQ